MHHPKALIPSDNPVRSSAKNMSRVRVAVAGCGYWGPNLIRNAIRCPITSLVAVCDADAERLTQFSAMHPHIETLTDFDALLQRDDVDAVIIATPVRTHAALALAALQAGKHVLVEKPMAASVVEAEQMLDAARRYHRVLMVDHTFIYSPPVRKIKELVDSGELGNLHFIDSVRINLGMFQHDVNVVWDLAPHDLSILDYLLGRLPRSLSAFGSCHTDNGHRLEDVAYLTLDFGDGLLASFHVNWLSPVKVRHFIVGGSTKSIVFNDLEPAEKVKVYDRGIQVIESTEDRRQMLIGYRTGDVWIPHLPQQEPLQEMMRHFAECILYDREPLTDAHSGLRVVSMLEAAQRSIKAQGGRITL